MTDFTKLDMAYVWASGGDKVTPTTDKIGQGFAVEPVYRQTINWLENRQDNNIAYLLQKGIPEWDATTEYQVTKSFVQRSGVVYQCISTGTNQDPVSAPTYWKVAFANASVALASLGAVTQASNTLPYFNGSTTATTTPFPAFGRSLVGVASASAGLTLLGAQGASQNLTALSSVVGAPNVLPYFDSNTTMASTLLGATGRSVLASADAPTARTALGLGGAAILNVGTTAGTVAAGNDARMVNALQNSNNLSDLGSSSTARTNLGLGNAATATVTVSASDTTAGRVLKVGDFGVGGSGVVVGDINALTITSGSGTYKLITPFTGAPVASSGFNVVHQVYDNQMTQYASLEGTSVTSPRYFMRKYSGGAWQTWVEFYHSGNSDSLVAQVQTGVQPLLDAKVNRAGDTMTGSLINTNATVGFRAQSATPKVEWVTPNTTAYVAWINNGTTAYRWTLSTTQGDGVPVTPLISVDTTGNMNVAASVNTPTLGISGVATLGSGIVNTTLTVGGLGLFNGNISVKGGVVGIFAVSASANAHTYYYGSDGTNRGITYFDSSNTFHVQAGGNERLAITAAGATTISGTLNVSSTIVSSTGLYAGSSFHDTNGNLYGPTWSGYLSSYLLNNFTTNSGIGTAYVNNVGVGYIGSYAFLGNTSGSTITPGALLSTGLNYASTGSNAGGAAGGTWKAMGYGVNGQFTLWLRVA